MARDRASRDGAARVRPSRDGTARVPQSRDRAALDTELTDLPPELRWREWMGRVEAVLFASAAPVPRDDLSRVVGQGASVDLLIGDISAEIEARPYEVAAVGGGWMLRTRPRHADAIRAAADVRAQLHNLSEFDVAVLAAVAYYQPIDRDGLADIFGGGISRDLIGRLRHHGLIAAGPRSPRRGAPQTFVTTEEFLAAFDLRSLRDLPDLEQLEDAGLAGPAADAPDVV